jgi:hypothetical protein
MTEETHRKMLANTKAIIEHVHEVNSTNPRLCSPQHEQYNCVQRDLTRAFHQRYSPP